ncbi:MAG: hypothetical protein ACRC3B_23480 [Bacteroidia bacterium]
MKLLLLYILLQPEPQLLPIRDAGEDQAAVKTIHFGLTRYVSCDVVKIKDNEHQNLLVLDFNIFRNHFRYAGEYSGHLIKGN